MAKRKTRTEYHVRWESLLSSDGDHVQSRIFPAEAAARLYALGVAADTHGREVPQLRYGRTVELYEVDILEERLNEYNKASAEQFLNPPRIGPSRILDGDDND